MLCEAFPINLLGSMFRPQFIYFFSVSSKVVFQPATKPVNVSKNGACDALVAGPSTLHGLPWLLRRCMEQTVTLMVTWLLLTLVILL